MTDQHPPAPGPDDAGDDPGGPTPPLDQVGGEGGGGRNEWEYQAPDPNLSFHGDIPTDPGALEDRPTGAPTPPAPTPPAPTPPVPGTPAGAAPPGAAVPPPPGPSTAPDADATRVVAAAPPLGTSAPTAAVPNRVGTRTAVILVGVAALLGVLIVVGLSLTGGDDGEIVATDGTPGPDPTTAPTTEATVETPEPATPTPEATATPTATPLPLAAATDLQATTAPFGGAVTERWELEDGRLTSTVQIAVGAADSDGAEGLYVVVIPTSVATDLSTVMFDPEPTEVVEADDPAAAFAVALEPGDRAVMIKWSSDVDLQAGETPEEALQRLLGDRAAAAFRFGADGPDLVINAPDDESTTIGSSVTLRGQTDADAVVTVNGDAVEVDADNGRFRTDIDRTRDQRELRIVATDPYGRSTELTWTVRFADPAPTPTPRPVVVPTTPPVVRPPTPRPPPPPPTLPPDCPPTDPSCR